MQYFNITLKNEKKRSYSLITFFFLLLNIIFFTAVIFDVALRKIGLISEVIIADVFLFVLRKFALQKTALHFTIPSIEIKNILIKKYTWDQFSNIILKDNILTLDFKNNRIIQGEIETTNINEEAFNTFAKERLTNTLN